LGEILTSSSILISTSTGFEATIRNLPLRVLRYLLKQGPKPGWDGVNAALEQAMNVPYTAPCTKADVLFIIENLCAETWRDSGNELLVRVIHCDISGFI
jgi:hypothetical protein